MAKVLSDEEIEQLHNAINSIPDMETKRPDKFSREQIRAITYIHETFAYLTTRSLWAYLRSVCQVNVSSVDELTYEEFIRTLPIPNTLAVINMNPLKGSVALEIDPQITFAIIDKVCGGCGDGTKFQHNLTDIEKSIMDSIIVHMLDNLRHAWNQVLDIRPQVKTIDNNPKYVRIVSPNEIVILVTLETKIEKAEGMINICIPCSTIEPIIEKLSNWYWNKNSDNTPSALSVTEKPSEEKSEHIPKENETKNFSSSDYLNRISPAVLANIIWNDHPQIIALVLAQIEADKASFILQIMPEDMRSNVFRRIATMDRVNLEITSEIVRTLENILIASSSDEENYSSVGGVDSAVKILNLFDQYTKESIIKGLEKEDSNLAEEIQRRGISHEKI